MTPPTRARRRRPAIGLALVLLAGILPAALAAPVAAVSPNIVISQVYGGGGNAGALYTHDFVELFNRGSTSVNVTGWSVQYASATGTGNFGQVAVLSGTVAPGQYYLVQMAAGAGGTQPLPTPDVTGSAAMAAGAGKVIVANVATALACNGGSTPCSAAQLAQIVDLVGYGNANFFEGAGAAPTLTNPTSTSRAGGGCTDTDNNNADFLAPADPPTPRNTASPFNPCGADAAPTVAGTTPAAGAIVDAASNISITFSEPVNVADPWFTISCSSSGAHPATVTGGPTVFTLNPTQDFTKLETCTVTILAASVTDQDPNDPPDNMEADYVFSFSIAGECGDAATKIHDIQGSGLASPMVGANVEIEGVVVGDFQLSTSFNGFYVQEEDADADADPATSEGIFVFEGASAVEVVLGDVVRVVGNVVEFSNLTELTSVTTVIVCSSGASVTPTPISLPFASTTAPERWEGMLVSISQNLVVSEVFTLARFGEVVLSSGDRLYQPTELVLPGLPALAMQEANNRNRIVLDDGDNRQNIDPTLYPTGGLSASNTLRVGDTMTGGGLFVMDERFAAYRLQPTTTAVTWSSTNPRTPAPEPVGGGLRVASFNVLNYFNGDGMGGGFPTARGAHTLFEFERQTAKIVSALLAIDADIVGLMEIENDANEGANSAIADLVAALNAATAPGTYAYIDTGVIGTDAIAVALIYQPAQATPVGTFALLTSADDDRFIDTLNRPTLAQTFASTATGGRFTVAVNHLKSKGSDCNAVGDPDTGDGQGNCNLTRLNASLAMIDWLAGDPTGSGDRDFLVMGDLNSYAMEDPIRAFLAAGYVNLLKELDGPLSYSYVFQGQTGTLDHALASPTLAAQVTGATAWHINPDEPIALDYNVEFKSANHVITLFAPDAYRSSDHDPALLGMDLLGYQFGGFRPPVVGAPGVTTANAGSAISVRFSLGGDRGLDIFFTDPWVQEVDCDTLAPIGAPSTAQTAGGSTLAYSASKDQYTFVWKTDKSWAGTCQVLTLEFADGTVQQVLADLR